MKFSAPSTIYLCYFGLREPLVQTQVLPYLRQLAGDGIKVYLVTFEPALKQRWSAEKLVSERARLVAEGIEWSCLPYHKRPSLPATLYDVLAGARLAAKLIRKHRIGLIHARGHVPALMGMLAKRLSGARLIFDIRGFMPEEYTDAGVWPENGLLYRGTKIVERKLFAASDAFVVLTEKAREILFPDCSNADQLGRPIEVIPCCVDRARFQSVDAFSKEELRKELQLNNRRVIVYAGALGGWYLTEEMAEFLSIAHKENPATFSLVLTQSDPELMAAPLRGHGVSEKDFLIRKVSPEDVPRYLKVADAALSFIKPCYSKLSSSPTKIAEYLASGLPIVCNAGIGDVDKMLTKENVGILINSLDQETYVRALKRVFVLLEDEELSARCAHVALQYFDLVEVGGKRYCQLYNRLEHLRQLE